MPYTCTRTYARTHTTCTSPDGSHSCCESCSPQAALLLWFLQEGSLQQLPANLSRPPNLPRLLHGEPPLSVPVSTLPLLCFSGGVSEPVGAPRRPGSGLQPEGSGVPGAGRSGRGARTCTSRRQAAPTVDAFRVQPRAPRLWSLPRRNSRLRRAEGEPRRGSWRVRRGPCRLAPALGLRSRAEPDRPGQQQGMCGVLCPELSWRFWVNRGQCEPVVCGGRWKASGWEAVNNSDSPGKK